MKMNKKGFTLIEMLVVIAVIAVLVSIVIPTVTSATNKAKLATDAANIRSAIASVTTEALANGTAPTSVDVKLKSDGKFTDLGTDFTGISEFTADKLETLGTAAAGTDDTLTVAWSTTDKCITIDGQKAK